MTQNAKNDPKMTPKWPKNDTKWPKNYPKMTQNGQK